MTLAAQLLRYAEIAVFAIVGAVATHRWYRRRGENRAWLAATFGLLAAVVVAGEAMPKHPTGTAAIAGQKALVVALLLFPYFLYRFGATFERPSRRLERAVTALVVVTMLGTVLLHRFPEPGQPRSAAFSAYVLLILAEWTFLSGIVAVGLWRAGRGQPTVARRRMRMLASGATALAAALVIAATAPSKDTTLLSVVVQVVAIVSAGLFLAGFAPPSFLFRLWRARDIERLQGALVDLAQAVSPQEVVDDLLPRIVALVGAQGASIEAGDGTPLGRTGITRPDDPAARDVVIAPGVTQRGADHLLLDVPGGRLELWTSAYTPYFGREEVELLRNVAALVHVTLERTYAHAREVAAREALDEAQALAHLGSWRVDLATGAMQASDEMYRLYDIEPGTPITRDDLVARVHPDDRGGRAIEDAIAGAGDFENDFRVVRADGSVRWLHARGSVLRDETGKAVAMLGTAQDVTEARRLDRMRREFVENAAHELRTPLTTVSAMASLLAAQRHSLEPAQLDNAFEALGRQGERARQLVTSLLDLSRIDAGGVPVQLAPVRVAEVVEHALETAPPPESTRVAVECAPDAVAVADGDRLHEILVNLLTNAYRYGGPSVAVTTTRVNGTVSVAVTDDGSGVPAEFVAEMFQPFSRAAGATGTPGSGLGLAISQRLAAALGGGLRYDGAHPGARFVVTLRGAS
jgi:signal transduction histidine kinase